MSYHIYQTEGLVLGGFNMGESNRHLYIFTKDLGLISASVQGVRELKSKLRYSLQDFTYANFDIVRGKQVWRVTNAGAICTLKFLTNDREKQIIFANIISLIKRLFTGEAQQEILFDDIVSGFLFLKNKEFSKVQLQYFEIIMVLKILNHLGYWGEQKEFDVFLQKRPWNKEFLDEIALLKSKALHDINNALKETHL